MLRRTGSSTCFELLSNYVKWYGLACRLQSSVTEDAVGGSAARLQGTGAAFIGKWWPCRGQNLHVEALCTYRNRSTRWAVCYWEGSHLPIALVGCTADSYSSPRCAASRQTSLLHHNRMNRLKLCESKARVLLSGL